MRGAVITARRAASRAKAIVTRRRRWTLWAGAIGAGCALVSVMSPSVASAMPAPGAVVISGQASSIGVGRVLVNSAGFSLYGFTGDGFSSMLGCLPTNTGPGGIKCTDVWVPVLATGPLVARGGVIQSRLGHITPSGHRPTSHVFRPSPLYVCRSTRLPGR